MTGNNRNNWRTVWSITANGKMASDVDVASKSGETGRFTRVSSRMILPMGKAD